ncbi:MAG: hypothetical protein JO187_04965, partial [Acidobacteria bacterium]|nr:hypothetical protein [Acidobacteriota bacterium]
FGHPAEFATGPYSARAIERRSGSSDTHHPGYGDPLVATQYFVKAAKLNVGAGRWELPLIIAAAVGVLAVLRLPTRKGREKWGTTTPSLSPALLLWAPLPFYALSVAYGAVPIFLPVWWPFSYYNVRYGLELLPAIAVFAACAFAAIGRYIPTTARPLVVLLFVVIVAGSYAAVWRTTPICLREARANGEVRQRFEIALAHALQKLPRSSHLLMSTGDHPGALERAGFPLRRVVNETNHPQWEQALAAPAQHVDYIIAVDNDDVAQAVAAHPNGVVATATVNVPNAPRTTIYKSLLREPR